MEAENEKYKSQFKLSAMDLLTEVIGFVVVLWVAITSDSVIMWMDTIDSAKNILECILIVCLSYRLQKNLSHKYNYGIGKIESLFSVIGDVLLIIGLGFTFFIAINNFRNPAQPSQRLFFAIIVKFGNVLFGLYFLLKQVRIQKSGNSKLMQTEFRKYLSRLLVDMAEFLGVLVTYLFRSSIISYYISPVFCMILATVFLVVCIRHIHGNIRELLDQTLPQEEQDQLMEILSRYQGEYQELVSMSTRRSGGRVFIDIQLRFPPKTSYEAIVSLQSRLSEEIEKIIGHVTVSVRLQ